MKTLQDIQIEKNKFYQILRELRPKCPFCGGKKLHFEMSGRVEFNQGMNSIIHAKQLCLGCYKWHMQPIELI